MQSKTRRPSTIAEGEKLARHHVQYDQVAPALARHPNGQRCSGGAVHLVRGHRGRRRAAIVGRQPAAPPLAHRRHGRTRCAGQREAQALDSPTEVWETDTTAGAAGQRATTACPGSTATDDRFAHQTAHTRNVRRRRAGTPQSDDNRAKQRQGEKVGEKQRQGETDKRGGGRSPINGALAKQNKDR